MFMPPNLLEQFGDEVPVGHSDWPNFLKNLEERGEAAIGTYLIRHETIEDFHRVAQHPAPFFVGGLRYFPRQHAIVLAALGRFDEAGTLLAEPLAKLEASAADQIERGQRLVGKRPASSQGKFLLANGARDAQLAVELGQLQTGLGRHDAAGTAALLHEWERRNVVHWGVEQHWQPTPFPFEVN